MIQDSTKPFVLCVLWLALLGATVFYEQEISAALWILMPLWWLALLVSGFAIFVSGIVQSIKSRKEKTSVKPLATALLPPLTLLCLYMVGTGWVRPLRFRLARPGYEATVHRVLAAAPEQRQAVCGQMCRVDDGQPVRIAFVEPGGILDNYTAIVYDPTGRVMDINAVSYRWDEWDKPRWATLRKLFGGDLVWAKPLGGPWYRCGFT